MPRRRRRRLSAERRGRSRCRPGRARRGRRAPSPLASACGRRYSATVSRRRRSAAHTVRWHGLGEGGSGVEPSAGGVPALQAVLGLDELEDARLQLPVVERGIPGLDESRRAGHVGGSHGGAAVGAVAAYLSNRKDQTLRRTLRQVCIGRRPRAGRRRPRRRWRGWRAPPSSGRGGSPTRRRPS